MKKKGFPTSFVSISKAINGLCNIYRKILAILVSKLHGYGVGVTIFNLHLNIGTTLLLLICFLFNNLSHGFIHWLNIPSLIENKY